ncbi:hypothetical protein KEM56_001178 [Ascosphaera pollenicola]|nr:hypothetical protein KEM56_001178 [Ascosphaera pollenicola]
MKLSTFTHGQALLLAASLHTVQASLTPVQERVSPDSPAGIPLSCPETIQLTKSSLGSLPKHIDAKTASYFAFADGHSAKSDVKCKVAPGDTDWPSDDVWAAFDSLLGEKLIKTVPSASPCYPGWGDQDSEECASISQNWNDSAFHIADPASIQSPIYQGRTCLPTGLNVTDTCTLGGFPSYVVNASSVADVQLAVNFARNANLRLVVKNTGHDFLGKSTGKDALSIWTHHLKSINYVPDYNTSLYTGPVVKAGSGNLAFELYEFANKNNFSLVGGEGETVGVTGGYILGGGHSPLSCIYGLAADQVIAFEVVLPNGTFTTVTQETNPDLFWALRGGGLASVGVVTSAIIKVHPQIGVTVSQFSFGTSDKVDADTFFKALRAYYTHFEEYTNAGTYTYFWIMPVGKDQYTFLFHPFFAVNHTVEQFNTLVNPWLQELKDLGIDVTPNSTYYDNYYDAWKAAFPLEGAGFTTMQTGSRLFPRENFVNETLLDATLAAHRKTLEKGAVILAFQMKADLPAGVPENAANTALRSMRMHAISSVSWDQDASNTDILGKMEWFRDEILGEWRKVTPGGGAYMSEAHILEPNWQESFYGSNYARLYKLKQEYDPDMVLYAPKCVGSENWKVDSADGLPDQNGRLCRV